jgi:hypothetical protein
MLHAFVFEKVAVLVFPWRESMNPPEQGARVEVRLLADEPRRGSPSAAQRIVIDQPVFRADLFDQVGAPAGNLRSAHFHPTFHGVEPSDRHWPDAIKRNPTGWLAAELGDLPRMLERSGVGADDASWLEADTAVLRDAAPDVIAAVEATWAKVRREEAGVR